MPNDIPAAICELVVTKHQEGLSQYEIGNNLNLARTTVSTIIRRHKETGNASQNRFGRSGRKKCLTEHESRLIRRESLKNPRATASQIRPAVGGRVDDVSISTVRRELRRSGLVSYRPVKSPSLSAVQMRDRLAWCRLRQDWTVDMWKKVIIKFHPFLRPLKRICHLCYPFFF